MSSRLAVGVYCAEVKRMFRQRNGLAVVETNGDPAKDVLVLASGRNRNGDRFEVPVTYADLRRIVAQRGGQASSPQVARWLAEAYGASVTSVRPAASVAFPHPVNAVVFNFPTRADAWVEFRY